MQFRYGLVVAWVVATIASMLVAFAAVGSVRSAIEDPPSALLLPQTAQSPFSLPEASTPPPSTVPDPEVDDGAPVASGDEVSGAGESEPEENVEPETAPTTQASPITPTSAQAPVSTTVPSTTSPPPPATEPQQDRVETYETEGGWVTLRADDQGVVLESASPKPGWTVKTEGSGPDHFTVVFEGDDREIHFKAEFEDGEVEVDIEH